MAGFEYFNLRIVAPPFESPLTDLIIELDYLRKKKLYGSTPPFIFFQLKQIFHMLESIASARIEGNNTTVADYLETKIEKTGEGSYTLKEIENMEECLGFIDDNIGSSSIDRAFVSELHKRAVRDLPLPPDGEGDVTPGSYRTQNVSIKNSLHIPPDPVSVAPYMDTLFQFIAASDSPKYDLLKIAIAHHRFVWIHPFGNGNGRTVRLFTYAMLIKYGFAVDKGRILNPAAVFCSQRSDYYNKLSLADTGTDENMLIWCEYVLTGLKNEIEKIDRLLEYPFLKEKILLPAINYAIDRKFITDIESKILKRTIEKQIIKASDLTDIIASNHKSERSRQIHRLKEKKMLMPLPESP
ncbi:MAG: Fic family protein, partial [candidate division Zixibacteria bacterium]|nr:Fic family protein [candidate division Zixibacteria bacterium]